MSGRPGVVKPLTPAWCWSLLAPSLSLPPVPGVTWGLGGVWGVGSTPDEGSCTSPDAVAREYRSGDSTYVSAGAWPSSGTFSP